MKFLKKNFRNSIAFPVVFFQKFTKNLKKLYSQRLIFYMNLQILKKCFSKVYHLQIKLPGVPVYPLQNS